MDNSNAESTEYVVGSTGLSVATLPTTLDTGYQVSFTCPACSKPRGARLDEDVSRFGPDERVVVITRGVCGAETEDGGACAAVVTVLDDDRSVWSYVHEDDGCIRHRATSAWSETDQVWSVAVPRCSVCGLPHTVSLTPEQRDDALVATFNGGESPLKVDTAGMEHKAADLLLRVPVRCVTGNGDGRTTDVRVWLRHGDGPYPDPGVLDRLDTDVDTRLWVVHERLESLARTDWADEAERRETALRKIREAEESRARLRDPFHGIDPDPLTVAPPEIPLEALPASMEAMVREVARAVSTPVEIPLVFALGVVAGATLGMYEAQVAAWDAGPSGFYAVALADPSERKTAALKHLERPLVDGINSLRADRQTWVKAVETEVEDLTEELRKLKRAKRKDPVREREVKKALRDMTVPMDTGWLVDDTTAEALGVTIAKTGERAIVLNAEATAFRTLAGAYSDKGGNYGLINKAFSRERHRDVRITREGVDLKGPVVTWAVAVQPGVMAGYGQGIAAESGFIPRFLMFLCESMVGQRCAGQSAVSGVVAAEWDRRVRALFDVSARKLTDWVERGKGAEFEVVEFSEEATELMHGFMDDLEERKRPGRDLWRVGPWLERHPERLARLAMDFTLYEDPSARTVEAAIVRQVLRLSEPLIQSGIQALALLMGSEGRSAMQAVLEAVQGLVRESERNECMTRDVHRRVQNQSWASGKGGAEAVREAMHGLAEMGWLIHVPPVDEAGRRGGDRRSEGWLVHPDLRSAEL